jgi:hypothetical protein
MSRTRSEGGATVVREEAITKLPAIGRLLQIPWGEILCVPCPPLAENRAEWRGSQLNPRKDSEGSLEKQLNSDPRVLCRPD